MLNFFRRLMKRHKGLGFHESTVVRFDKQDTVLELALEDVLGDGGKSKVSLTVSGLSRVEMDDAEAVDPLMAADDGEILTLKILDDGLSFLIEWKDYVHRQDFIRSYRVFGDKVSVNIG